MSVQSRTTRRGFSIIELLAVLTILGIVAVALIPRATSHVDEAERRACFMHQAEIELQAQLWRRNNGGFPAGNLSDIGANLDYFPEGVPVCPVDGTAYTIDTTTGLVIGHTH